MPKENEEFDNGGLLHPSHQAEEIRRHYVCSKCWSDLKVFWDRTTPRGMSMVVCHDTPEHTVGFVSKYFAEQQEAQQRYDLLEIKRAMGIDKDNRPAAEQLKDLGF
jgi:hypothetical protein